MNGWALPLSSGFPRSLLLLPACSQLWHQGCVPRGFV